MRKFKKYGNNLMEISERFHQLKSKMIHGHYIFLTMISLLIASFVLLYIICRDSWD